MINAMHTTVGSRKQKGLTLVEIMVAIVISLILTAGIIQLFLGTTQTYRFQEALSRIQENGRYAMEVLARDIRMAGYWGCASADLTGVNSILNGANNYAWNFSIPVEGFEADGTGWTPTIDPSIVNPLQGSDILTLRSLDNAGATIAFQPALPAATIHVVPGHQLAIGQVVIATDCVNATAFQITNINNVSGGHNVVHSSAAFTPGNATNSLGYQFTSGEILTVSTKTYYVREGSNGVPALWRSVAAQPAQELVEGVERMRITYGIDNNNNNRVDEYVGVADIPNLATGGPDWGRVVSVRVELLLVSMTDNITGGVQPIEFAGETITPTDNRLRQVFTTTVGVRNRLP
ncbi:PilW family protein [Thioalkalivibrio sulfidiphilus]|uniref:PilW family protein n=1 Tax=Thioalkalivibrio sulfidiphilus TaxID=1033854 RepID=UPI000360F4F0|nr:PilW family protein [Thioalkalivibrio sulfidiphilus]